MLSPIRGRCLGLASAAAVTAALLPGLVGIAPAGAHARAAAVPAAAPGKVASATVRRVAVNAGSRVHVTRNGQRAAHVTFRVRSANGTGIVATSRSWARASCRNCRAVAVAVEIIVEGHVPYLGKASPDGRPVVVLNNIAVAEDVPRHVRRVSSGRGPRAAGCSSCSALAISYQFAVLGRHRLRLTPRARASLARIERQMRAAAITGVSRGVSNGLMQARMDRYARQIAAVLDSGVVLWPH
jgi:hypothetical protein